MVWRMAQAMACKSSGVERENWQADHLFADFSSDGAAHLVVAQGLKSLPGPYRRVVFGGTYLVMIL